MVAWAVKVGSSSCLGREGIETKMTQMERKKGERIMIPSWPGSRGKLQNC